MSVYIGRQPILDDSKRTQGYELLYRDGNVTSAFFSDPENATRYVIERSILEWGLSHLVGNGIGFFNVTQEFLRCGMYTILPADRVVLELPATLQYDGPTIDAIRGAVQIGYRIALDDVVTMNTPGIELVLPLVDIVKVEMMSLTPDEARDLVISLRRVAPKVVLLAQKVESIEMFELCRALGFQLFQGYFFAKPELLAKQNRPTSQQAALSLMTAIQDPDITIDQLADLASGDPTLAYRLLKFVNSSSTGLLQAIDSVRHAIVMLGLEHVRQLAVLLTMSASASSNQELITLSVTRAHMARHLVNDPRMANGAFTMGLLSVIDAVYQAPMYDLLEELPLHEDVRSALLVSAGPLGEVMEIIRAYERADVAELDYYRPLGLEPIRDAFGDGASVAAQMQMQLATLAPLPGSGRRLSVLRSA